jgi:glycosyltransferase involved in cell wall biosynthesis
MSSMTETKQRADEVLFRDRPRLSVILCTHNPRADYLRRAFDSLRTQTCSLDSWELLVVDNASREPLASSWDLSWHPRGRHVREETLGLVLARLRGIDEAAGDLLVFVDDDNVLAPDYLERAIAIFERLPFIAVLGAGSIDPEFEREPSSALASRLQLLTIRRCLHERWSNNPADHEVIPWGAGLCVRQPIGNAYVRLVSRLPTTAALGRVGDTLFAGDDDVFSWAASAAGWGFGVFPELRLTHLIEETRVHRGHLLRLAREHAFSHGLLQYMFGSAMPPRIEGITYARLFLHLLRNGLYSMRCQWAVLSGQDRAARFIRDRHLPRLSAEARS